jgi:branched-chain amino acid transport system permease protein
MSQLTDGMVFSLIALAWDMLGGQMGYNCFGNVLFFGTGMYLAASVQVMSGGFNLAEYTSAMGGNQGSYIFTPTQFIVGFALGIIIAGMLNFLLGLVVGSQVLQMRGHYFAIATLGLGVAAGEIARTIDLIGAGSGMNFPQPPAGVPLFHILYYTALTLAVLVFTLLRWLYRTRFGVIMNAIRDDEDKAEAMGLPTAAIKTVAWAIGAFVFGCAGVIYGSGKNFIDPTEIAFAGATIGVWMILMAIMGGMGTLWGPIIGAVVFQVFKEFFWTFLFGWQRVALGLLIVVIVVFFPNGIMGAFNALRSRVRGPPEGSEGEAVT